MFLSIYNLVAVFNYRNNVSVLQVTIFELFHNIYFTMLRLSDIKTVQYTSDAA